MEDIKIGEENKELKEKYRRLCIKVMKSRHKSELNKIKKDIRVIEKQLGGYLKENELIAWAKATVEIEEHLKGRLKCFECPFLHQKGACYTILSFGALVETESVGSKLFMNFLNEIDRELIKALERFWIKLKQFVEEL